MKKANLFYTALLLLTAGLAVAFASSGSQGAESATAPPGPQTQEAAMKAFDKMMAVLTHKRCVNCHPAGDRPRQGEDSHYHNFGVRRGEDGHGLPALQCATCHQQENNDYSGVPGAPDWGLAPLKMQWEGLSRVEIARSILDPARNGGRTLEETVHHLTEHELVLWAWEPGVDGNGVPREKPPVPKEEYIKAVKEWAAAGAPIPEE